MATLASGTKAHLDLTAERNRRASAERRDIDRDLPKCAYPRRRKLAEKDLTTWSRTYLPAWFPIPCSANQLDLFADLDHVAKECGTIATASPRGDGKTSRAPCLSAIVVDGIRLKSHPFRCRILESELFSNA